MSGSHPVGEAVNFDKIQPILIGIPSGGSMSATFVANFLQLDKLDRMATEITIGPYVQQNMRLLVRDALRVPGWERLLIVENDMLLPRDALIKHALHTDPVVGSMYFQHVPPYHLNAMLQHPEHRRWAQINPLGVAEMIEVPALYEVDIVGLGCTSIRRDVFEQWPPGLPTFRVDYEPEAAEDEYTMGEVSHDVWFCQQVREQGYKVFIDTTIRCGHITQGWTDLKHFVNHNRNEIEQLRRKQRYIIKPNGSKHHVTAREG